MDTITIGKLAKEVSLSTVAIRYYERIGLIPAADRKENRYRYYSSKIVSKLKFIKNAQFAGFTLEETKELLELQNKVTAHSKDVRQFVQNKLNSVQERIKSLQTIADNLTELIQCCDGTLPIYGCPIINKLETAPFKKGKKNA